MTSRSSAIGLLVDDDIDPPLESDTLRLREPMGHGVGATGTVAKDHCRTIKARIGQGIGDKGGASQG